MKKRLSVTLGAALTGGLGFLLVHSGAQASAFNIPEASTAGIGLANALVANPDERGAFAYNPAAMGFHVGSGIALGTAFINPNFSVTTDRQHDGDGTDWLTVPMLQGMAQVHDRWRVGFAVNAPFGLETNWVEGAFPRLTGSRTVTIPVEPGVALPIEVPNGDHPTLSKLETISLVPSLAYRVNDALSLSVGLDYYNARDTRLDSTLSELEGSGTGWGWNLSFLYAQGPWSVGAAYHSSANLDISGTVTILNDAIALLNFSRPAPVTIPAVVDLDLPWRFQIGVRYEINEDLAVEADWSRTGWSKFKALEIKSAISGDLISTNTNELDDSNAYRLGVSYSIRPDTRLRFGYTYDQTGQGDEYFSARIADSDRHLFSVGAAHELGQGWTIEGAYMYVNFEDRDYSSSKPYRLGDEVNGTEAINGEYSSHAHILGIEVSKVF